MPNYAFRCNGCGHEFEVQTSWSAKADVVCPECGAGDLKELFGRYRFLTTGGSSGGSTGGGSVQGSGFT
ncbi:MAG: zinc ribbon domain-containing protein [Limnochordales bacterium]|nr:zinc ribbon domain-containing protein [Limnochordales bacterium]